MLGLNNSRAYSFLRIVLRLPKVKLFGRVNLNFKFKGITAEIITIIAETVNFARHSATLVELALSKSVAIAQIQAPFTVHRVFSVSLSLAKAKLCSGCPTSRMPLYMNFPCQLAGTTLSTMICPGTFVLSPGSPFSFFLSFSLALLFPHKPLLAESLLTVGSSLLQRAQLCVSLRETHQGEHPPLTLVLFHGTLSHSLSLPLFSTLTHMACVTSHFPFVLHQFIRNLVPVVNRECPGGCTWMDSQLLVPSRVVCMMNYETLS